MGLAHDGAQEIFAEQMRSCPLGFLHSPDVWRVPPVFFELFQALEKQQ